MRKAIQSKRNEANGLGMIIVCVYFRRPFRLMGPCEENERNLLDWYWDGYGMHHCERRDGRYAVEVHDLCQIL